MDKRVWRDGKEGMESMNGRKDGKKGMERGVEGMVKRIRMYEKEGIGEDEW